MMKIITNIMKTIFIKKSNKKGIATSTIGYFILGLIALAIIIILIYKLTNGSLGAVDSIFGG